MKVPTPRQLPSGSWFIQMRLGGQSVPVTAETRSECITRAQLIKAEHKAGKRITSASGHTIGDLVDDYIASRKNILSPTTLAAYASVRDTRFKSLMKMQYKDVKSWQKLVNEEAKLCSPKSLKNAWSLVRASIAYAQLEVPTVTLPQIQSKPHEYLTPDQITVFVEGMRGKSHETAALLGLHGLRKSEIFGLTWDNVDLERKSITIDGALVRVDGEYVYKQENKNRSSKRTIPILIDRLYELLQAQENKTGFVITSYPELLFKQVNTVCKNNNLPKIGVHGLRHSFASLAYHLGVPERIAMQMGGWSDMGTMHRIYTHIAQRDVDNYADELRTFFKT